jgi:hypothetical protein
MKKYILLLTILLVLTGCNVKADITVTEDKLVSEKITVSILNSDISSYGNYTGSDEFLDYYKNEYSSISGYKEFNIKTKKTSSYSIFTATREYNSIEDYVKSYSFLNLYDYATVDNTGSYLTFKSSTSSYIQMLNNEDLGHAGSLRNYEINVKFYNEVLDSNADKVDKSNNIYTWYLDSEKQLDSSYIYFKLGPKVKYMVKFKDYIIKNLASIIIVITFILLVLLSTLYIIYKSKKNNEI